MDSPEVSLHAVNTARRANVHIAEMAESLDSIVKNPRPIAFLCECGCLEIVELTLAAYRASSDARIEGHR